MGGQASTPAPRPSPVLAEPWRTISWRDKQKALDHVNNYQPVTEGQRLRILLHGPVGAGKSSFINSVETVLKGRLCVEALADSSFQDCFTKQYTTYEIERGRPDVLYPFIFNDVMGLSEGKGVLVDDVKLAFKGHIKDDYKFNPESELSEGDPFYNPAPSDNDRVHVLVCVIAADTLSAMTVAVMRKIRDIRLEASRLGIPQVAVLTKVDKACPEVEKDLKNVYRSRRLKETMLQFSADSGIPVNCIFPVMNYHQDIDPNSDTDCLILNVLKHMIHFGDDFINRKLKKVHS